MCGINQLGFVFQVFDQNGKLISTETGNDYIVGAKTGLKTLAQDMQQMISGNMTQGVIDMPEIVQVDQEQANHHLLLLGF